MHANILVALLLLFAVHVQAQSDVYLCVHPDGLREYRNTPEGSACNKVHLPHLVIVKPDRAETSDSTAMPPPESSGSGQAQEQAVRAGHRQALEIRLRTAEARLVTLQKEFNGGEPERRGDERNYARYLQRVSTMQEEVRRAQRYVDMLKQELNR